MLVVTGIEFYEHRVGAGGEVAFHNFGNLLELGYNRAIHGTTLKVNADVGASGKSESLWINFIPRAGDDTEVDHTLDALVHGGTRHSALFAYGFRRYAGIMHDYVEDLFVEFIYLFHALILFIVLQKYIKNRSHTAFLEQNVPLTAILCVLWRLLYAKCQAVAGIILQRARQ